MSYDDSLPLDRIFFPIAAERSAAVIAARTRFAYYTTAEVAYLILKSRQLWLRNAMLMNDFSEIAHGLAYLGHTYRGAPGEDLKKALAKCFAGLPEEVENYFNTLLPTIRADTYLACFSEHDASEDVRGRLSMWRAYGRSTGVALVINGDVMHSPSNALGVFSSPVFYGTQDEFDKTFHAIARNVDDNATALRELGKDVLRNTVFQVLRFAVLCTKHPGFEEEREWRVIASPSLFSTPHLRTDIELIRGTPQKVVKIDLEDVPEEGLTGLNLDALLDRVIIGPCAHPHVTGLAFVELLNELGVTNVTKRVVFADIPLRHDA